MAQLGSKKGVVVVVVGLALWVLRLLLTLPEKFGAWAGAPLLWVVCIRALRVVVSGRGEPGWPLLLLEKWRPSAVGDPLGGERTTPEDDGVVTIVAEVVVVVVVVVVVAIAATPAVAAVDDDDSRMPGSSAACCCCCRNCAASREKGSMSNTSGSSKLTTLLRCVPPVWERLLPCVSSTLLRTLRSELTAPAAAALAPVVAVDPR